MTDYSRSVTDIATSLEFRFLIDRCLAARRDGNLAVANVYAFAAEGLLTRALPDDANNISSVASRKGDGRSIGSALAQHLSPTSAASVNVIWLIRGARRPAIDALSEAFRGDAVFNDTIRLLCARALAPAAPVVEHVRLPSIEIAAAYLL